jgi:uncharacterized protein
MTRRLLAWPARRPWATLAITALVTSISILGIMRMRPTTALGAVFGRGDAAAAALDRILADFSAADEIQVLVTDEGQARDPHESAARLRAFATRFEQRLLSSPDRAMVSRLSWKVDPALLDYFVDVVVPAGAYILPDLAALHERLAPDSMREQIRQNEAMIAAPGPGAAALSKQLLRDPLRFRELIDQSMRSSLASPIRTLDGGPEFISEDGKHLLIRVGGHRPVSDLDHAQRITDAVRRAMDGPGVNADHLRIDLSGAYAIADASSRSMRSDMTGNIYGSLIALQLLFLLAYRGVLSFPVAIIPVVVGNAVAFGAFSLYSTDITPIIAVIGSLLAGLGIEYSVHYLTHFEARRNQGMDPAAACEHASIDLAPTLAVGCATSIVGFMAAVLSSLPSIRSFAILGSLGLALTVLATLTVMPALMVIIDRHAPVLTRTKGARFSSSWLIRLAAARPRVWITATSIAALVAVAITVMHPTGRLRFESDLTAMHPRPNAPLSNQKKVADIFGDVAESLLVHIDADSPEQLVSRAHEVDRRLRDPALAGVGVTRSIGLAAFLPDPGGKAARDAELGAIDPQAVVSDFRGVIRDSAFDEEAYKPFEEFLRTLLRPANFPSIESFRGYPSVAALVLPRPEAPLGTHPWQSITLVMMSRPLSDAHERDAALAALESTLRGVPGVTPTGIAALSRTVERTIRHDVPTQVASAAVIVALINFVFLRRLGATVLSYAPVAFSVVAIVAFMTITGERINLANMLAIPLIFGLGIDFGLFTVQVAKQCEDEPDPAGTYVQRVGHSVHAFFINTLTTILGFGSLVFTSVPALQSLGRIMIVAVAACMVGMSLFVVPIVVLKLRRRSQVGAGPQK